MTRVYVLDTSVLIFDPLSIENYSDCSVVIYVAVLDELDKLKKQPGEVGKNARVTIRMLDKLSETGDISVGVLTEKNALVSVDTNDYPLKGSNPLYGDNLILSCAYGLSQNPINEVVLVSNDVSLRVRAKSLGIETDSLEEKNRSITDLYSGMQEIQDTNLGNELLSVGYLDPTDLEGEVFPNQCILFKDEDGKMICAGRKMSFDKIKLVKKYYPWKLNPRNQEQILAADLISDPSVPLVTLVGKAGGGKTLISLATALDLVINQNIYQKLIIYRPIQPMGNDIGYVPGTIEEKLIPWFSAVMDNFETLFTMRNGDRWQSNYDMYAKKGKIQLEALTYIRGRSIPNALILIDEAQNLDKQEIKTILTRAGEGSKIILTGDIEQLDRNDLDATSNGLVYVIEKFKNSELAGHIILTKGERSKLATAAADLL
jgi:PhoH-like ATPase